MEVRQISASGVKVFTPKIHRDARGMFLEGHRLSDVRPHIQIGAEGFVQSSVSSSVPYVVRGLHYQLRKGTTSQGQGKLIRCVAGRIFQVSVDVRRNSETFGSAIWQILDDVLMEAVWVPPGHANGFFTYERGAVVQYEMTAYHDESLARELRWDDAALQIPWPVKFGSGQVFLSPKDRSAPFLSEIEAWS